MNRSIPTCFLVLVLSVVAAGCAKKEEEIDAAGQINRIVEISQNFNLDLTNHFRISEFASWSITGQRGSMSITLAQLHAYKTNVQSSLSQMRRSDLYQPEFPNVPIPEYLERAPWWAVPETSEFARFFSASTSTGSLNVYIIENGMDVIVNVEEIRGD